MRHLFRVSVILVILGSFFVGPLAIQAAGTDTRCFTKTQCEKARGELGASEEGFYDRPDSRDVCGTILSEDGTTEIPLGFCLPVGQSTTKVSFGGKKTFANFGDFIQYGYRYGMWVAGIIAVAFIVISGVQWAASGGNSDMISSAKNRISGAITGLILLTLSYTILNTVNPYLVQLRLPQAWMINTIDIVPPSCGGITDKKLAYLGQLNPDGTPINQSTKDSAYAQAKQAGYKISPQPNEIPTGAGAEKQAPLCGYEYLVEGGATLSCRGDICAPKKDNFKRTCLPFEVVGGKKESKSTCWIGDLIINYRVDGPISGLINKLGQNLIPGGVEQSDDDYWLEDQTFFSEQNKDIAILPVCQNVNPNFYWIVHSPGLYKFGPIIPITQISNVEGFDQYVLQFHKTNEDLKTSLSNLQAQASNPTAAPCGFEGSTLDPSKTKIVGFFIGNHININYESTDGNLFIGLGNSKNIAEGYTIPKLKSGYVYTHHDLPWLKNYIPIDKLNNGNGMFLNFGLTSQHIDAMKAAQKSWGI